jgi:TonB family protein
MNAVSVEPATWSRKRWLALGALVLAAHLGSIFWLRESPQAQRRSARPILVHLAITSHMHDRLTERPTLFDPTLFALPGEKSFSRAAWLKFTPPPRPPNEWIEPPLWLKQSAGQLGKVFPLFVATSAPPAYLIAGQDRSGATVVEVVVPSAAVATQSFLRLDAELASRPLRSPVTLLNRVHTDILINTVVQVVVDADGLVTSARLLAECGSEAADQDAVALARTLRFERLRPREDDAPQGTSPQTTIGQLVFEWKAVPLAVTNISAILP